MRIDSAMFIHPTEECFYAIRANLMGILIRVLLIFSLTGFASSSSATIYYVSTSGADTNAGTSATTPWRSIKRLNAALLSAHPGDTFLLKRSDVFRDTYIYCGSQYQNGPGGSLIANPPKCAGSMQAAVTIGAYGAGPNPLIDSADVLGGTWKRLRGTTYQLQLPAGEPLPLKLFVDPTAANGLQQQLLPVPNFVGICSPTTKYAYLDMWQVSTSNPAMFLQAGPAPAKGCSGPAFRSVNLVSSQTAAQAFAPGQTGLQNVEAGAAAFVPSLKGYGYPNYPGVWYVTGSGTAGYTVFVNLADGSDPNHHVVEATHRNYGVFVEGTNHVTVQDLTIAHSFESCALGAPFSDTDPVEQYLTFQRLRVFNCASMQPDFLTVQHSHPDRLSSRGGIVLRSSGAYDPPNLLYPAVLDSYVGTVDTYFGTDTLYAAGILLNGVDGGGTANRCLACGNHVSTTNSPGLNITVNVYTRSMVRNNGGRVAHNELTNNQSNIGFASVAGGMLDHNYVHESYGQGIQLGGNSSSVDGGSGGPVAGSQVVQSNIVANLGQSASLRLYNGIDCNSSSVLLSGLYEIGNTVVNTWGAGVTFEGSGSGSTGCTAVHFWNNVVDQHYNSFGNAAASPAWTPGTQLPNNSNALYVVNALHKGFDFRNNFYRVSSSQHVVVHTNNPNYACESWLAGGPDLSSVCDGRDPLFSDLPRGDFRPQSTSPLRMGRSTVIGAAP